MRTARSDSPIGACPASRVGVNADPSAPCTQSQSSSPSAAQNCRPLWNLRSVKLISTRVASSTTQPYL